MKGESPKPPSAHLSDGQRPQALTAPECVSVPDHELLSCVGKGSYGQVWLARSLTGSYRAIKIVRRNHFAEGRPFEREFEGIRRFEPISRSHPGFISILHVGRNEAEGYFYVVMELADDAGSGELGSMAEYVPRTLSRELIRRGRIPVLECVAIAADLTSGLAYLHDRRLVHRDIKPSNIVFVQGVPKFADVGLVTEAGEKGSFVGTEGYLPPEGPGTPQADVYGLGLVLYQMMSGKSVSDFPEGPTELTDSAERAAFGLLNDIIIKACDPSIANRFPSGSAMARALVECQRNLYQAPWLGEGQRSDADRFDIGEKRKQRPEGERKKVTVLCCRVVFTRQLDPEVMQSYLHRYREVMRREIARFDGAVGQTLNDGLLGLFGAPVAYEDHPQRAVHAAMALHRALTNLNLELPPGRQSDVIFRSGLECGVVVLGGGIHRHDPSIAGESVHVATRLCENASPGQIWIGENLKALISGFFILSAVDTPVGAPRTYSVQGLGKARSRIEVEMERGLSPFVGRDREMALLEGLYNEASEGRGQIVLVAGEAGMGKSRLFLELRNRLKGKDLLWLTGRSLSMGAQMPFFPIIDLLKQYFGITEEHDAFSSSACIDRVLSERRADLRGHTAFLKRLLSLDDPQSALSEMEAHDRKNRTIDALEALFLGEAHHRPLVLVVEDLHWIDKSSEDFLTSLGDLIARTRCLMLVNYRPGYRSAFSDCSYLTRIVLNRLSEDESTRLARGVLASQELSMEARRLIADKADGNPFFVEELIKSLTESGLLCVENGRCIISRVPEFTPAPETVQDVLMSRIDRLDPAPKKALQLASVIGREFPVSLLETIAELGEPLRTSLQRLQSLELLYEIRGSQDVVYVFKHALTQDVAYHSLLIQRRQELHRCVAASIEEIYAARLPEFYSLLAYHYERGEEWTRALDYLVRAAQRSREVAAYREEAALLTRAIVVAERLGEKPRACELLGRRGVAWHRAGLWREARADLEKALAELPEDQVELRAEWTVDLAAVCFWGLDVPALRVHAEAARELADRAHRSDLVSGAMGWQAAGQQSLGNLDAAIDLYKRAVARDSGFRFASLANYPLVLYLRGEISESIQCARKASDMCRTMHDTLASAFGRPHLGLALAAGGQYREALKVFEEARHIGAKYEIWPFHARSIAMAAGFHLDIYDYPGNEALALEARELGRSSGFLPSAVSAGLDLIFNQIRRGEVSKAESLLEETMKEAEILGGWHGWLWQLRSVQARAELALVREDWSQAIRWADESVTLCLMRGRPKYEVAAREVRARALAALGRTREAVQCVAEACDKARKVGDPALFLRIASTRLQLDGSDELLTETRNTARRMCDSLPEGELLSRFLESPNVRRLKLFPV